VLYCNFYFPFNYLLLCVSTIAGALVKCRYANEASGLGLGLALMLELGIGLGLVIGLGEG